MQSTADMNMASPSSPSSTSTTSWFSGIVRGRSDKNITSKNAPNSVSVVSGAADNSASLGPVIKKNHYRGVLFRYGPKSIQVLALSFFHSSLNSTFDALTLQSLWIVALLELSQELNRLFCYVIYVQLNELKDALRGSVLANGCTWIFLMWNLIAWCYCRRMEGFVLDIVNQKVRDVYQGWNKGRTEVVFVNIIIVLDVMEFQCDEILDIMMVGKMYWNDMKLPSFEQFWWFFYFFF